MLLITILVGAKRAGRGRNNEHRGQPGAETRRAGEEGEGLWGCTDRVLQGYCGLLKEKCYCIRAVKMYVPISFTLRLSTSRPVTLLVLYFLSEPKKFGASDAKYLLLVTQSSLLNNLYVNIDNSLLVVHEHPPDNRHCLLGLSVVIGSTICWSSSYNLGYGID